MTKFMPPTQRLRWFRSSRNAAVPGLLGAVLLAACGADDSEGTADVQPSGTLIEESVVGGVVFELPVDSDESTEKIGSSSPPVDGQTARLILLGSECFSGSCSEPGNSTCTILSTTPGRIQVQAEFETYSLRNNNGGTLVCTGDCRPATADCGEIVLSGQSITIDEPDSDLFVIPLPVRLPWMTFREGEYRRQR